MNYTLTKYLTADYFRDNDFTRAFLELVDEVIFCCYMESREILSQLSFEDMDDEFFLTYQSFFLNGLSTYNIENIDKLTLSEWFSLLHVRGELSDLYKLLKFGGSLKSSLTNNKFELFHNADVPETIAQHTKDGIIYAITDTNISLDEDFFINQQVPAGYRLGLIKTLPPTIVSSSDNVVLIRESASLIHCIDAGRCDLFKEKIANIALYRRRQFDQYYTFKQLYQSAYTINELSQFHCNGTYFNGFDIEISSSSPTYINETKTIYTGIGYNSIQFFIENGLIEKEKINAYSGSFADGSIITFEDLDGAGGIVIKNYLSRHPSIMPFNGELVAGGNIKTTPIPSEEGDYGYMNDTRDFDMSYIEIGHVGKPTVFYSSILTEKTGEWGTIPMSYETRGYLRSAAYQGSNKAVTANSTNYLYLQGESGGMSAEADKTYTLTGAYTNTDASVSIEGCSLTIVSSQVRLVWGATAAQVCYVTIEVS